MKQILLLTAVFISSISYSQNQWQFLGEYDAVYAFRSANHFIYIDNFIELKISTDGGVSSETSSFIPGLTSPILKGHFIDENTIMMVQQDGPGVIKLIMSSDGGANFSELGEIGLPDGYSFNTLHHIYFYTEMEGVVHLRAIADGEPTDIIMTTTDGANTWTQAATSAFTDGATELDFFGDSGMRLYRDLDIQESTDFGATWTELGPHPLVVNQNFTSQGDLIWGVGDGGADNPCNTISSDVGASFNAWNIPDFASDGFDGCGERIQSLSSTSLMVSGHEDGQQNEVTLHSVDGGETFVNVAFPDEEDHSAELLHVSSDGNTYIYQTWDWYYVFTPNQISNNILESEEDYIVSVFPNPNVTGLFQFSRSLEGITIYNQTGQEVYKSVSLVENVDLSHLERGIYFASSGNQRFKLIIH